MFSTFINCLNRDRRSIHERPARMCNPARAASALTASSSSLYAQFWFGVRCVNPSGILMNKQCSVAEQGSFQFQRCCANNCIICICKIISLIIYICPGCSHSQQILNSPAGLRSSRRQAKSSGSRSTCLWNLSFLQSTELDSSEEGGPKSKGRRKQVVVECLHPDKRHLRRRRVFAVDRVRVAKLTLDRPEKRRVQDEWE